MPERRWLMYRLPKTVRAAQRRIARHMAVGRQARKRKGNPAHIACAACGARWETSSPGDCPSCQRYSYAVSR